MKLLTPLYWKDYELIDSGNFRKLERFGKYCLARPEPQAVWNQSLSESEWDKMSNAEFRIEKNDPEKGKWILKKGMPEQWWIRYSHAGLDINMRLGLTSFRHIGVFPEQAENWDYIYDFLKTNQKQQSKVLNLFAYTGGASLAARASGADVYHVDSVKPVITWARENMEGSNLSDIRWIVEDALKFVKREVRRGSKYQGIILDPPAYGRGADGEKWILDEQINEMVMHCSNLLEEDNSFLILNMYSIGFSAIVADNLVNSYFKLFRDKEIGELFLIDSFQKRLPLGTFVRFML
ncbi:MAG: class I SAM-dependent methyltransferase [Bacteroidales bacterium]|nr:class I SAM-dependent methyltransferase [Bacteroidales bacterium]